MATPAALTAWRSSHDGRCARYGHAPVNAAQRQPDAAPADAVLAALLQAAGEEVSAGIALRRELHASPELGGHETGTASRVAAALGEPDAPSVTTGRLVRIGAASGPSVAIRAELDALPLTEQTPVSWASQNGASHSCGRDQRQRPADAAHRPARRSEGRQDVRAMIGVH